ncbi:MAG: sulfotransferase [Pseudomonadota bacterium]
MQGAQKFVGPVVENATQTKSRLPLSAAVDRALKALGKGDLDDAAKVCQSILRVLPENPDALHILAIVTQRRGDLAGGITLLQKAISFAPKSGQMLANLCEMTRISGDATTAAAVGRRAVRLAPGLALAHSNLGIALYDCGDLDGAFGAQKRALELAPNMPSAINNIASILRKRGDEAAAEAHLRRILEIDPNHGEAIGNLASLLLDCERPREAIKVVSAQIRKTPQNAELHRTMGRAFLQVDELNLAELAFNKAIELNPSMAEAILGLAEVYQKKNHPALALDQARKAADLAPDLAYAFQQMGHFEADLGNVTHAFAHLERALSINPDFTPALLSRGYLHMENGDMELAKVDFARVAALKPGSIDALFSSVRIDKIKPGDPHIAQLESLAADADKFLKPKAIAVHYSLAKCYEDTNRHDDAFEHFEIGGRLKRSMLTYDADAHDRKVDALIAMFDRDLIAKLRQSANHSAQPIFVLGMPRSGTTLTESIIANHPLVFGAGELNHIQTLFPTDSEAAVAQLAELLGGLAEPIAQRITGYVERLNSHAPGSPRITDKMPANFFMLGLIHALLPNARIIHVARDAVDTCVSCFTRLFERSQYHTYDQIELGRYFNAYSRIMAHWGRVLPQNSFYTVQYEALVEAPETESRAILDYCGLKWDDACLSFHTAKRRVRTASVTQVRSPVYLSSVQKWRQYENHLGPLLSVLERGGNYTRGI